MIVVRINVVDPLNDVIRIRIQHFHTIPDPTLIKTRSKKRKLDNSAAAKFS
jgi:hypothetical protein